MTFLRVLALLALAYWIGGLATLGSVTAPAIFDELAVHDPAAERTLAPIVFGEVLDRFHRASWVAAAIVLVSLAVRRALGPRPRRFGLRTWTLAVMLAASLSTAFLVSPRIEAIRASVPGSIAGLPETDARRVTFGRLHALSSALMGLIIVAGIGLIWAEANDHH